MIGKGSKGLWRFSTGSHMAFSGSELNDLGYMTTADEINQDNVVSYGIKPTCFYIQYL